MSVPLLEGILLAYRISSDIGDLNPDASVVALCGVLSTLLQIEGLIDCSIDIKHEMDT